MRHYAIAVIFVAAALSATQAQAESKACIIEADMAFHGQRIVVKDCSQYNRTDAASMLKQNCEGMASFTQQMGLPPGKLTYVEVCPPGYQAACLGMMNGPFDSYYYKRSAEELVGTKASCEMHGGTWKTP